MNFNISNHFNFIPFLTFNNQNKYTTNQLILFNISTALKRSLQIYQIQWKSTQITSNTPQTPNIQQGKVLSSYNPNQKTIGQKHLNSFQQNKKSIQKISYNNDILKNDKINQNLNRKQFTNQFKISQEQQKQLKTSSQYLQKKIQSIQKKRQKIIHQKINKQIEQNGNRQIKQNQKNVNKISFIDYYQGAYIPTNYISNKQIQQKRQKLLLRKVFNWKQIDKRVGFRKMELKKLLG